MQIQLLASTRWVRFDTFLLTWNVSWIIWRTEYQPQQFHHKQLWQDVYSSTDVHQQDIQLPPLLSMPCVALLVTSHADTKYEVPHKMHISLGHQRQHKSVTTLYDFAAAAGVHMYECIKAKQVWHVYILLTCTFSMHAADVRDHKDISHVLPTQVAMAGVNESKQLHWWMQWQQNQQRPLWQWEHTVQGRSWELEQHEFYSSGARSCKNGDKKLYDNMKTFPVFCLITC